MENSGSLTLPQIGLSPLDVEIVELIESELKIVDQIVNKFDKKFKQVARQKAGQAKTLISRADYSLLTEALKGLSNLFLSIIEYFSIWFAFYPMLLFISLYLFEKFFLCNFPCQTQFWLLYKGALAGMFGIYFFSKLFIPYVTTQTEIQHFRQNREEIRFNTFVYSLITITILTQMNLLNESSILFKDKFWQNFQIFFALYFASVIGLKYYYQNLFSTS